MRLNWTQNHAGGVFFAAPRGGHVRRMRACTRLPLTRFYLRSTRVSTKLRNTMHTSTMDQDVERVYRSLHPEELAQRSRQGLAERLRRMASYLESGGDQTILGDVERNGADGSAAECNGGASVSIPGGPSPSDKNKKKKERPADLDFTAYSTRFVALQLLYLGHGYDGFARQESSPATVEARLFTALERARLLPVGAPWQAIRYSRGGRTDRGVSACGQVVAMELRSAAARGQALPDSAIELDYPALLNRVLPDDIRVTGWCDPRSPDFSARFSAAHRDYTYMFVCSPDQMLDLEAMREAGHHFLGTHDFRNFCKMDVTQVKTFVRTVLDLRIEPADDTPLLPGGRRMLVLSLRGTAFLWHQVRCMAAVLRMVGQGLERPDVVMKLLDVDREPAKPLYTLASEEPLLLSGCAYPEGELEFVRSRENHARIIQLLGQQLDSHLVRAGLLAQVLGRLTEELESGKCTDRPDARRKKSGVGHVALLKRVREPAMEDRLAKVMGDLDQDR